MGFFSGTTQKAALKRISSSEKCKIQDARQNWVTDKWDWLNTFVQLDMNGCICNFKKWQIHPFISEGTS